jgi:putative phosphonate metabolism protein
MRRFAIYFAPPEDSPLTQLASAWLGRDAFPHFAPVLTDPPCNGFSREVWRAATADPRMYGFHATLKPPFRLVAHARPDELFDRARAFARTQRPFEAPALQLSSLSSFIALTLAQRCKQFEALAEACVREFDAFRAPPSEEEFARRRRARLSQTQLQYLNRWGYPYVMDEWRFHMTLTSSLQAPLFDQIGAHLKELFAPHCSAPLVVDSICIFEQPSEGEPFEVVERFAFA